MAASQPVEFQNKFFREAVDGVAQVAAGFLLYTWAAGGTSVPQTTYTDATGLTPAANPIPLDDDGTCELWLDPALEYALELRFPIADGNAQVRVWDPVSAAARTTQTVQSVNGLTGVVALTAAEIPYTTSSAASWLAAGDVEAALDQIADRANAPPADSVTVADSGALFTGTNVEDVLAELAARVTAASPGRLLRITYFKATGAGTWTKAADVGSVVAEVRAGGGSTSSAGQTGGGQGGFSRKRILAADLGATETTTTGDGGAAGGNAGGSSSFGSHCSATGGAAGTTSGGAGGVGGVGSGGDLNLRGAAGQGTHGGTDFPLGGGGGEGGGQGAGGVAATAGFGGAANTGGGGGGGTNAPGGSGLVTVWEYS